MKRNCHMKRSLKFAFIAVLTAWAATASIAVVFAAEEECEDCVPSRVVIRQVSRQEVGAIASGKQKGMIIDSRSEVDYKAGHIPGARSVPVADKMDGRLPKDKATLLVFYCGGERCPLSTTAAQNAVKLGYNKVAVYKGGWTGWTQTASR